MRTVLTIVVVAMLAAALPLAETQTAEALYQEALLTEEVKGDLPKAIALYRGLLERFPNDRAVAARALLRVAACTEKLGGTDTRSIYERIVREFPDQPASVNEARAKLALTNGSSSSARDTGVTAQHVWTNRFVEGAPSPNGRYVAWVNYPAGLNTGSGNLTLHDLVTGRDRELTHVPLGAGFAGNPHFTPDSQRLFYMWYDLRADQWSLRLIDVDGRNERLVSQTDPVTYSGPVSPDGRFAATITRAAGAQQIAITTLASGATRVLKTVDWRSPQIGNFSPDGRFVVYSLRQRQDAADRAVFVMAVDGSAEFEVVTPPGENRHPLFTPDGTRVVFASNRSGRWDLWSVRVAGGKAAGAPELIKPDVGPIVTTAFANDGTLFYSLQIEQREAFEVALDRAVMRATGAPKRLSTRFVHNTTGPFWSADGSLLAYAAPRGRAP